MPRHDSPSIRLMALAIAISSPFAMLPTASAASSPALPAPVLLWPAGAPDARGSSDNDQPAVYPFLPAAVKNTGAAVLIVSGGGFTSRRIDAEGVPLAKWLNDRGIAGFVLRYRIQPYDRSAAIADVNRAVQYLRAHAADFKIAPDRIAALGFANGAEVQADAAFNHQVEAKPDATDPVDKVSSRPDFLALVWGSALPVAATPLVPPTFLVGSTNSGGNLTGMIDLWTKLRAARASVDAHFFAKADAQAGLALDNLSLGTWPEMFYTWARFGGFLTAAPRLPIKGMAYLDGRPLPHGYVIFTPVDSVGAGPVVGRVINSTAGIAIGQFSLPAGQGPVAGRYKVDVRQNMNRWLSNSFSGDLVNARGMPTPEQAYFGHHRVLAPSIDDQRSFTKVHPTDTDDYIVEIKPGADANMDLKIEVFSAANAVVLPPANDAEAVGGILGGPKNPGQVAYVEQIKQAGAAPIAGIPAPILLWPNGAPGALPDANGGFTDEDKPALYAFPAPASHNTGLAFLVIPGGAFTNRGMDNEGVQIAKFLNQHGIGGFVLRYRIGPNYPARNISTMDGQRGMRYIRAHAAEYGITPDRIGIIGFSAGAELEGDAFYNNIGAADPGAADPIDRVSARANFSALIYGGRNLQHPAEAPPTFLFNTIEDASHMNVEVSVMNAVRAAGVPVEAHFYQVGPHGTSMSLGDPQLGQWPDLMVRWLKVSGFVAGQPDAAAKPR